MDVLYPCVVLFYPTCAAGAFEKCLPSKSVYSCSAVLKVKDLYNPVVDFDNVAFIDVLVYTTCVIVSVNSLFFTTLADSCSFTF